MKAQTNEAAHEAIHLVALRPWLVRDWMDSGPLGEDDEAWVRQVAHEHGPDDKVHALADVAAVFIARQLQQGHTDKKAIWNEARQLLREQWGARLGGVA